MNGKKILNSLRVAILSVGLISMPNIAFSEDVITTLNDQLANINDATEVAVADTTAATTVAATNDGSDSHLGEPYADGARPPRPSFQGGEQGGRKGARHPSNAQRQAFESCMAAAGVQRPKPPELTAEQKAAFDSCRSQSQSRESFEQCMQGLGISPPARPQLDSSQIQLASACRQKAMEVSQ